MFATKVEYKVSAEFSEKNKANIKNVYRELAELNQRDVKYQVFFSDDGQSFFHLALHEDPNPNVLPGLPAFQAFIAELKASALVSPPVTTKWKAL